MKENSIRRAVREGRAALGTGLKEFASRGVPWIIEASGFDYCMIDHEHGAFDLETIADLAGWFQATDVSAIVRIHKSFTYLIPAILDQGIMGIQVSEVDNAEEARAIAQVAKYPPIGDRGISGQGMHTGYRSYGARHASEYAPWANANIIVCVSIEAAASSAHHSTAACDPDRIVDHFPPTCDNCAQPLPQSAGDGYVARQVFDLPDPAPLMVTEHRAHRCRCAACGTVSTGKHPDGVRAPVQYGERIAAIVVYLATFQFVPEDRLATLMQDLFGVSLARATIGQMSRRAGQRLLDFATAVHQLILSAPVKHFDETGFRIVKRLRWLHIAATAALTFYRIGSSRGDMLSGVSGIVVHDHWKSYDTIPEVEHALCNAHHLRELQALVEIEHEDWAQQMQVLLRRANHAEHLARIKEKVPDQRLIDLIGRRYDAIVAKGLAFHAARPALAIKLKLDGSPRGGRPPRRVGHNLLLRLSERKQDVLRFLTNPDVPFTNNQAERDARMMKLKQKISGCFRSVQGADDFAVIRTLIGTAKKRGWGVIQSLLRDPHDLIADLSSA